VSLVFHVASIVCIEHGVGCINAVLHGSTIAILPCRAHHVSRMLDAFGSRHCSVGTWLLARSNGHPDKQLSSEVDNGAGAYWQSGPLPGSLCRLHTATVFVEFISTKLGHTMHLLHGIHQHWTPSPRGVNGCKRGAVRSPKPFPQQQPITLARKVHFRKFDHSCN
jgi:hypothetical protein